MVREIRREAHGSPRVGLFVTCLVDAMRPSIGFAAIALLEMAGCRVEVPLDQTCCGQPALNSGDREGARRVAQRTIALLEPFDHVVVPSGSCAATIRVHYRELFHDDQAWLARAEAHQEIFHQRSLVPTEQERSPTTTTPSAPSPEQPAP